MIKLQSFGNMVFMYKHFTEVRMAHGLHQRRFSQMAARG